MSFYSVNTVIAGDFSRPNHPEILPSIRELINEVPAPIMIDHHKNKRKHNHAVNNDHFQDVSVQDGSELDIRELFPSFWSGKNLDSRDTAPNHTQHAVPEQTISAHTITAKEPMNSSDEPPKKRKKIDTGSIAPITLKFTHVTVDIIANQYQSVSTTRQDIQTPNNVLAHDGPTQQSLQSEFKISASSIRYPCPQCRASFTRASDMRNHFSLKHPKQIEHFPTMLHPNNKYSCPHCPLSFAREKTLRSHIKNIHKNRQGNNNNDHDDGENEYHDIYDGNYRD